MTITTRKPLTTLEQFDLHAAYHVSGMMDRDCQFCVEVLILASPADYQEYFAGGK
jgi:hypothetical protein